jgi:hypothetical protein
MNVSDKQKVKEQLLFITKDGKPFRKGYDINGHHHPPPIVLTHTIYASLLLVNKDPWAKGYTPPPTSCPNACMLGAMHTLLHHG